MNQILTSLSLCLLASGCIVAVGNTGPVAEAVEKHRTRQELEGVIDEFKAAYESGEIRRVFLDSIADSDSVIVIGSLSEEWTVGADTLREGVSGDGGEVQFVGRDLHSSELQGSDDGTVGWLIERADLHYEVGGERVSLVDFRATSIWGRVDGEWKIVHFHGSMPDLISEI